MSYTGFFADEDLYEVAKDGDPTKGSWVVPVDRVPTHRRRADFVTADGRGHRRAEAGPPPAGHLRLPPRRPGAPAVRVLLHPRGADPVHRLARRSRSCSTRTARARPPREILELTICEPALGSGAFAIEAVRQLAAEYLKRRQDELGERDRPRRVPASNCRRSRRTSPCTRSTASTSTRPPSSSPRSRCGSTPWSPACRPRGSACTCAAATR